ncbi:MAG: acyl-CoA thioesterase II [Pseudomonadaceae bacterium]|nr:acyl-CoA thioesterase II [Pseudomonadaceae bacterium]
MTVRTSPELASELLSLLELEAVEENLYRGSNEQRGLVRLFGGQVLSQALRAASNTVDPQRLVHSLHGYFIRPGSFDRPVLYEVERIRDGRSFNTRRVLAIQNGEAIFSMDASYQVSEDGLSHAKAMPNVPPPESLMDDVEFDATLGANDPNRGPMSGVPRPFELRSVYQQSRSLWSKQRAWNPVWVRFSGSVDAGDAHLPGCLLAYASDMAFVSTLALAHSDKVKRDQLMMASLDHALWLHRPVPIDDWLLFVKRATTARGGRGMNHAEVFARDGSLVASVSQEGLVRLRKPRGVAAG